MECRAMANNVVLITGCSSGFGLACATGFARRGDQVVATMRNPSQAGQLQGAAGITLRQLDVTQADSIQQAVEDTLRDQGCIDVLVNNAGIGAVGALEMVPDAMLREVFETNVF